MKQNNTMSTKKIIGVTGGIGAGKSTVISYLQKKGFLVINADNISRLIVFPNSEASVQIRNTFGHEYFTETGLLDRAKLGQLIFHNPNEREKLNEIMYPLIWEEILRQIAQLFTNENTTTVFVEAAVLLESGGLEYVDEVWVVICDENIRLERIMKRDHLDKQNAQARIDSQMSQEQNIAIADIVLDSSCGEEMLYKQIDLLV